MPFETVYGMSHRKIPQFSDREKSKIVPNLGIFGRPIADGLVEVKCVNRLMLERVAYQYNFGPVGYESVPEPMGNIASATLAVGRRWGTLLWGRLSRFGLWFSKLVMRLPGRSSKLNHGK